MTISTSTHGSTESAHEGEECRHRWAIETPSGKFSTVVCNLCGEKRQFQNYIEGSTWGSDVSLDHLIGSSGVGVRRGTKHPSGPFSEDDY